jgi:thiamine pyrophosphate-dependent acetolactate synthase large subunit-like protein
MGAWAAAGHEPPIVSVSGDGGFGQYLAEFNTAVKYVNITHILLNNSELGKISKEQRAGEWDVWQARPRLNQPVVRILLQRRGMLWVHFAEALNHLLSGDQSF